ncbi:MAG TPA: hypothetical protein VF042_11810 [Gemmatimonadaceae bacterium]
MLRPIAMILVLAALSWTSADAQRLETLPRGSVVHITIKDGSEATGRLQNVSEEKIGLLISARGAEKWETSFNRSLITSVKMRRGSAGRGALKGAVFGLLIAGGGGFLVGAATYDSCNIIVCSASEQGAFFGFLAGLVGLPAGAVIGASHAYKWEPVGPP